MNFLCVALDSERGDPEELERAVLCRVAGVRQLGHKSDCVYDRCDELFYISGGETKSFSLPERKEGREKAFCNTVCSLICETPYDYVYFTGMFLNSACLKIAEYAKRRRFSAKVIFEPDRYPLKDYCREMLEKFRQKGDLRSYSGFRSRMIQHRLCLRRMRGMVDTLAVRDIPVTELWGTPAITVHTGITVASVSLCTAEEELGDPISMLGVAEPADICGYGRILRGILAYQSKLHRDQISFSIVGGEPETAELKMKTKEFNLSPFIRFLGPKSDGEIIGLCNTHTVAVSCLGLFQKRKIYYSPRLTKLFSAAGIPFLYAYEDVGLTGRQPFALKLADIDAPVSMEMVGEFVWRCRLNPRLVQLERRYAENNYDWRVIMKRILEFTATGRRGA